MLQPQQTHFQQKLRQRRPAGERDSDAAFIQLGEKSTHSRDEQRVRRCVAGLHACQSRLDEERHPALVIALIVIGTGCDAAAFLHHFRQPRHLMNARASVQPHEFLPCENADRCLVFMRENGEHLREEFHHDVAPASASQRSGAIPIHKDVPNGAGAKGGREFDCVHRRFTSSHSASSSASVIVSSARPRSRASDSTPRKRPLNLSVAR